MNTQIFIKQVVSAYLNDIASRLSNQPDDQRANLLKQLESHIYEALDARCAGKEPTLADLESVFQEMDPPDSYGEVVVPYATPSTINSPDSPLGNIAISRLAISFCAIGWCIILLVALRTHYLEPKVALIGVVFEIFAVMLGIATWNTRLGKMATIGAAAVILVM